MTEWLIQQGVRDLAQVSVPRVRSADDGGFTLSHDLAVFVKPLIALDTQKWFGSADLRLDALIVHGGGANAYDLYHPQTFRFPRVQDGDDLAPHDNGLLLYYGRPTHFLALTILLARDTRDSDDLAALIQSQASSAELQEPLLELATLAHPSVELAAVRTGLRAAIAMGELAYKLVRQVSPSCLGLYRCAWLGQAHRFGVGRHPETETLAVKDFRFAYEIVVDRDARHRG